MLESDDGQLFKILILQKVVEQIDWFNVGMKLLYFVYTDKFRDEAEGLFIMTEYGLFVLYYVKVCAYE